MDLTEEDLGLGSAAWTGFLKRRQNEPENCGFLINDCTAPLTVIVVVTVMVRVLEW